MRLVYLVLALSTAAMSRASVPPEYLQTNHKNGDPPPFGAVDDVQTIRLSGQPDAVGETQPADCPTIMISTATPGGDHINGWKEMYVFHRDSFSLGEVVINSKAQSGSSGL